MSTLKNWTTMIISLSACVCLAACSSSKSDKQPAGDENTSPTPGPTNKPGTQKPGKPVATPTAPPTDPAVPKPETKPMGAEKVSLFNYEYGKGKGAYKKVAKAKKTGDWAAVKSACEKAIGKDPWHLHAHFSLAQALVQQGEMEAAVGHLDTALAGDWQRWGPWIEQNEHLKPLWGTDSGDKIKALALAYSDEFMQRVKTGVWMLGQRTRYKRPAKIGKQWSSTRGEIYAYDLETKRFLRITHTRERVAGWVRSPSGDEIAWVGYWEVLVPDPTESPAGAEGEAPAEPAAGDEPGADAVDATEPAPVLFSRAIVGVLDGATLVPIGKQAVLRKDVARMDVQYRTGDELIVSAFAPDSLWREPKGEPSQRYTYDKESGKLKKLTVEPSDQPILSMTHERVWTRETSPAGFSVATGEAGSTLQLDGVEQAIALPAGASVVGVSRSPDKAFALVRTVAEPCTDPPSGSLYVADAATGKLAHLLRGNSQFHVSWIDDRKFAYEDDGGRIRIHDLVEGKQVERLKNGGWLMLSGLAGTRGIVCPTL